MAAELEPAIRELTAKDPGSGVRKLVESRESGDTMTKTANIEYSDDLAAALELDDDQLPREIGFMAAAKLYELGRVTAGQAAELARLPRLEFLQRLAEAGVAAVNLYGSEVDAEIEAANELAG
jgi:predicted HTH domain antitoxin